MGNVIGIAIVWFIIEMLVWYLLAHFISGWWVFGWFVVAAVIGFAMIKKGLSSLKPMATQMQGAGMFNPALRPAEDKMTTAVAYTVAGVLFALPGVLSDILAVLALLPPVQKKARDFAKNYAMKNQDKLMQMMASRMGGLDPSMMAGMGGAGQNPFGNMMNGMGGTGGFSNSSAPKAKSKFGTTIDGQAKLIKSPKTLGKSANDE